MNVSTNAASLLTDAGAVHQHNLNHVNADAGDNSRGKTKPLTAPPNVAGVVAQINAAIRAMTHDLRFYVDTETGLVVVKVLDAEGQPIRQLTYEHAAVIAEHLKRTMQRLGLIVDVTV